MKKAINADLLDPQVDDLKSYICKQLFRLQSHLPSEVFDQVIDIFRRQILQSFLNIVEEEIQVMGNSEIIFSWIKLVNCFDWIK